MDNGRDLIGVRVERRKGKSSGAGEAAEATAVNVGTVVGSRLMADNRQLDMGNNTEWQLNSSLSNH